MPTWKPTTSTWDNVSHELNPTTWSFFDYAGIATGGAASGLSKLASSGETVGLQSVWKALKSQVADPVSLSFGLPVTGLWAEGSALSEAHDAGTSNAGWKDLALTGVNIAASIAVGAAVTLALPELAGVALIGAIGGTLAAKATKGLLETWEANHPETNVTSTWTDNGYTHTSFENGDFIVTGNDGYLGYYDAASRTKINIEADGSKTVDVLDNLNNIASSMKYDSDGNLIGLSRDGTNVAYDGDRATVTSKDGSTTSLAFGSDESGNPAFQLNDGSVLVFNNTDQSIGFFDDSGNPRGSVGISSDADNSVTYTLVDADGNAAIKTISEDGSVASTRTFDAYGNPIATTVRTVDSTDGSITFDSENVANGTHTTMSISADGNSTQVEATDALGSSSSTLYEPGDSGAVKSTVKSSDYAGDIKTDVSQLDGAGTIIRETVTVSGTDGSSLVTTTSKDGTVQVSTDAQGNTATQTVSPDGTTHIVWTLVNGITGTKDIDRVGNIKESYTVHMEGTDVLNSPMEIGMWGGGAYAYKENLTYETYRNIDGTSGTKFSDTVIGGFLGTEQDYPYADNGPQAWVTYPTMSSPGRYDMHDLHGNISATFTYTYDPTASYTTSYEANRDAQGRIIGNGLNQWYSTLWDESHKSMLFGYNGVVVASPHGVDSADFLKVMQDNFRSLPSGQLGHPQDFSPYSTMGISPTSSTSGQLRDNQRVLTLTGRDNLTIVGNALDDTLIGNRGNDTFIAGSGNNTMIGGRGHNTFVAGIGDNTVIAGSGGSEIVYSAGNGNLTVKNSSLSDTLHLGDGIEAKDIVGASLITDDGSRMLGLSVAGSGLIQIRVGSEYLNNVTFADGTSTTLDQLLLQTNPAEFSMSSDKGLTMPDSMLKLTLTGNRSVTARANNLNDIIIANSGDDTLIAGNGNDILVAGSGNDTLVGNLVGRGLTTYAYSLGNGKATILKSKYDDTIKLGAGITESDLGVIFSTTETGARSVELVTQSGVDIVGIADNYNRLVGNVSFEDGSSLKIDDLQAGFESASSVKVSLGSDGRLNVQVLGDDDATVRGGDQAVLMIANGANDTLIAGAGDAILVGGGGTTEFQSGSGNVKMVSGNGPSNYHVAGTGNVVITGSKASDWLTFDGYISQESLSARTVVAGDGTLEYMLGIEDGPTITLRAGDEGDIVGNIRFAQSGESITLSQLLAENGQSVGEESGVLMSDSDAEIGKTSFGHLAKVKGGYATMASQRFADLQAMESASNDYKSTSANILNVGSIEQLAIAHLVAKFDQFKTADSSLAWNVLDDALAAHLFSGDTSAISADFGGHTGNSSFSTVLDKSTALSAIAGSQVALVPQSVHNRSSISGSAQLL